MLFAIDAMTQRCSQRQGKEIVLLVLEKGVVRSLGEGKVDLVKCANELTANQKVRADSVTGV